MKMSKRNKGILIVAATVVILLMVYKVAKAAKPKDVTVDAIDNTVIGNYTLVSPESTITIGKSTVTPASKSWSVAFVDSLEGLS